MKHNKLYLIYGWLFCLIAAVSSCAKTEDLDALPQDKILEYKIVNLPNDEVIYGSINNQNNTITVYVPYYYSLLVIDAEIEVSPGAKIDGEILPVNVSETEQTYTVVAADGTTRTYQLLIEAQNTPSFWAEWASTSTSTLTKGPNTSLPNISGNFGHTNPAATGITLINQETGERIDMPILNSLEPGDGSYILRNNGNLEELRISPDITAGLYDVEVRNLNHTVQLAEPLTIRYVQPNAVVAYGGVSVNKNGEWTISSSVSTVFLDTKSVTVNIDGQSYPLTIKSESRTQLVVTFPSDLPVGSHVATVVFEFEGWNTVTKYTTLMISES